MSSILAHLAALAALPAAPIRGAILRELTRTERVPVQQLFADQLERVAALFEHAARSVPYYAERYAEYSFAASEGLEGLRRLPIVSRADLRDQSERLQSSTPPSGHEIVRSVKSSGSTGIPITIHHDRAAEVLRRALVLRNHLAHRRDPRLTLASIRAVADGSANAPEGGRSSAWCEHPESGPLLTLDVSTPISAQIEWLLRNRPNYLTTYATNASSLLAFCEKNSLRFPELREISTFAELLEPELRKVSERVLGVPLFDSYSASETGYIAIECPEGRNYHVQSEHVLVEILRDDGDPCDVGEVGRVVVTSLHEFAMPLLRYEVGDFASFGKSCLCGRTLPVLERIVGRSRNMLVLENGDRFWPRYGSLTLREIAPFEQFRLVQKTFEKLVLEFVIARDLSEEEKSKTCDLILTSIGRPLELHLERVAAIPRSSSGKFEDFVSEVKL